MVQAYIDTLGLALVGKAKTKISKEVSYDTSTFDTHEGSYMLSLMTMAKSLVIVISNKLNAQGFHTSLPL
jgi:hypothetical protein